MPDTTTARKYTDGQVIEYTSFDPSGWTVAQVVRYAPDDEQTRPCPNCGRQVIPGPANDAGISECPECLAYFRFPPLNPLVYVRTRSGGKPFTVRESQLRLRGRYTARITPEAWQRDQAIEVDAPGPQEWDATEFARQYPGYLYRIAGRGNIDRGVTDVDDLFRGDPAAPAWDGPFTITIRRETQGEGGTR